MDYAVERHRADLKDRQVEIGKPLSEWSESQFFGNRFSTEYEAKFKNLHGYPYTKHLRSQNTQPCQWMASTGHESMASSIRSSGPPSGCITSDVPISSLSWKTSGQIPSQVPHPMHSSWSTITFRAISYQPRFYA